MLTWLVYNLYCTFFKLLQGSSLKNFYGINYTKIDVIHCEILLVVVSYTKICFIELTPVVAVTCLQSQYTDWKIIACDFVPNVTLRFAAEKRREHTHIWRKDKYKGRKDHMPREKNTHTENIIRKIFEFVKKNHKQRKERDRQK